MRHHENPNTSPARGFTLIETLVALVVLSIGLLGVAGLQLMSLRSNHGSEMRSQATFLAYDIIDRMRANRASAINGDYNIPIGTQPVPNGVTANDDLAAWKTSIAATLPGGDIDEDGKPESADGSVTFNAATNVFTVTIVWDESHAASASAGTQIARFSMDTQLFN